MTSPPAVRPDTSAVVVVGAGLAGGRTCAELRAQGYDGRIVLLGAEALPPYDRPPLSKREVGGTVGPPDHLGLDLGDLEVDFRPLMRATSLSGASLAADEQLVVGTPQADLPADAVVVASGAVAVVPLGWGLGPRVHVLRSHDDAVAWSAAVAALERQASVIVLGGSWIGLEAAASLAASGRRVTIMEQSAWLLPALPPEVGRQVREWAEDAGVDVLLGAPATALQADSDGVTVTTATRELRAALVLVALGAVPDTGWLQTSGLRRSPRAGALRTDASLRTADPRVVALGDAAERWSPRYDDWLPGGHWQDAFDAPAVAAASVVAVLAGQRTRVTYDAVPYFWSEMFGHMLQWTGWLPDYRQATMVRRGRAQDWTFGWLSGGGLAALLACDRPRDAMAARKAQSATPSGAPHVSAELFVDPEVPLKRALAPPVAEGGGG
ncbi:MAG: FAD-dependent oxidoreductase [Candidatus Nanopelagicales bacterium]